MISTEIIGYTDAFLTTMSFLPQAIKTIRTRSTKDISLIMYIMFITGVALWFVYGLHLKSMPMIIGNAVSLLLSGIILIIKLSERSDKDDRRN